jgi:hypothetical protein
MSFVNGLACVTFLLYAAKGNTFAYQGKSTWRSAANEGSTSPAPIPSRIDNRGCPAARAGAADVKAYTVVLVTDRYPPFQLGPRGHLAASREHLVQTHGADQT